MTSRSLEPPMSRAPCTCGAHTQHRVFQFLCKNGFEVPRKHVAEQLHLSLSNVKVTIHELRKRSNLPRLCPECFSPTVFSGICHSCGCETLAPQVPVDVDFEKQSPTNSIHAGSMLGSEVDFLELRMKGVYPNDGLLLKQRMDRTLEDFLTAQVKSQVMDWLKASYPAEAITDYAGRLCIKEVLEFRANYPLLRTNKNVKKQLGLRVISRLKFLYPSLCRPHAKEVRRLG